MLEKACLILQSRWLIHSERKYLLDEVIKIRISERKYDEKLNEALSKNLESVKLLISDGQKETNDTGVFDSVLKEVSAMLNVENGYFSTKTDSLDMQIKTMNSRIERANTRLTKYEEQITKQFNKMDELISTLNSQFSTFSSYFG